ncbi:hypothetical protein [Methylobacterium planeticum]|uniref:Uncharacterized protein n=1 Tax=Methylobacterium planeticum TaxID=2615211 RepID=A0A6N6MPW1_9HYPH|nr:hypothetical protein [Methylobacterium planeticum]KAB1073434.1 hypothetical protein F6X51_11875 [Methylobacterium planeticum]
MASKAKGFDVREATDVEFDRDDSFLLPMCMAKAEMMLGEETAIILLETADGAQLGIPLGHRSLEQLHVMLTEALRRLKTEKDVRVQ